MPDRRYIRHPVEVPIEIEVAPSVSTAGGQQLRNVGAGGLCFHAREPFEPATRLRIRIPVVDPSFEVEGWVIWCRRAEPGFEVGVEIPAEADDYRLRMVEQLSHIEDYRRSVAEKDGRKISAEQAAREWISRYAGDFPQARPPAEGTGTSED
jgi:hypothetical protein